MALICLGRPYQIAAWSMVAPNRSPARWICSIVVPSNVPHFRWCKRPQFSIHLSSQHSMQRSDSKYLLTLQLLVLHRSYSALVVIGWLCSRLCEYCTGLAHVQTDASVSYSRWSQRTHLLHHFEFVFLLPPDTRMTHVQWAFRMTSFPQNHLIDRHLHVIWWRCALPRLNPINTSQTRNLIRRHRLYSYDVI